MSSSASLLARLRMLLIAALLAMTGVAHATDSVTCTGRFPNPITDICWSCILPISIGSATIANFDGQEDIPNPSSPVCTCGVNPTIGLSIGFWEPARHVEVVRKPFCLVSLGGVDLDPGIAAPSAARRSCSPPSRPSRPPPASGASPAPPTHPSSPPSPSPPRSRARPDPE